MRIYPHSFREDDTNWPKKNIVGKQELEIRVGNDHIAFEVRSRIISFSCHAPIASLDCQNWRIGRHSRFGRSRRPSCLLLSRTRSEGLLKFLAHFWILMPYGFVFEHVGSIVEPWMSIQTWTSLCFFSSSFAIYLTYSVHSASSSPSYLCTSRSSLYRGETPEPWGEGGMNPKYLPHHTITWRSTTTTLQIASVMLIVIRHWITPGGHICNDGLDLHEWNCSILPSWMQYQSLGTNCEILWFLHNSCAGIDGRSRT